MVVKISDVTDLSDTERLEEMIKSWRLVCLFVLTISGGFYLFTQGSHVNVNVLDKNTSPQAAAMYGQLFLIPVCAFFYAYTYHVCSFFYHEKWQFRLPQLYDLHLPYSSAFLKKTQTCTIVVIFFLPVFSLGHCFLKSLEGTVYLDSTCKEIVNKYGKKDSKCEKWAEPGVKSTLTKFIPLSHIFDDKFKNEYRYNKEMTYFPGWQPWLLLLLILSVYRLWWRALKLIINGNNIQLPEHVDDAQQADKVETISTVTIAKK